ncbi:hypothetical protein M6D81_05855 [Paenibacillus sp. J5C_2022]|uniref:glycosyl hydrolase family 95 catalytic domain-containing protein n=1 Tax=Paenibacillus sp. J5C2022 TaxID=2977129 RepID=UPI0021CFF6C0|nr:hypothetical protein [Paenibacillus sp. J5C2022]MCU6708232.1 hypothetical protein [Paenibacillus sp. J5C2022]
MSTALWQENIDWPSFLGRHDLTWSVKPVSWDQGAFIGNGWIGAMIYCEEHRLKRHVLRFVLGRTDVTAKDGDSPFPPRVPVGELHLELAGWIYQPISLRLHLWDAELRADITTTAGHVRLRALAHRTEMTIGVELETSDGERDTAFNWYAHHEVDRIFKHADGINLNQYIPESEVVRAVTDGVHTAAETFLPEGSGGCATAWSEREETSVDGSGRRLFYLSIQNGADAGAIERAVQAVNKASGQSWDVWLDKHRSWWHDYYRQSFLSIPDTMLEGFYWIQMYKLASATSEDGMLLDNQGPWMTATPWPGVWFNMNVQMAYSPVYASNRLELGQSLVQAMRNRFQQLIGNVPEAMRADSAGLGRSCSYDLDCPVDDEKGNLIWVCHNIWRQYRYSMDIELMQELLFPLLKRAVQHHIHLLEEGEDGKLHLPPTISPEYGSFLQLTVPDCHYDLALLMWGCRTLLRMSECSEIIGSCDESELQDDCKRWRSVLDRLAPLPVDETGFMVGGGQPLEFGHRHFSHLMAAFPLQLVSADSPDERELIAASLRHWFSMEGDLRGFSFTGAASIAAALGWGDEAHAYLQSLIHLLKPNTMYKEAGPVIESPLAGAEAIHDMLLQSRGDTVAVFPAMPGGWREASFHQLRAEGAFLVSAVRSEGRTAWIAVRSLAGSPCTLMTDMTGCVNIVRGTARPLGDGCFELKLNAGEELLLVAEDDEGEELVLEPVATVPHMCGFFGSYKPWRRYGLPVERK